MQLNYPKEFFLTKSEPNLTNVLYNVIYLYKMSKIVAPIFLRFNIAWKSQDNCFTLQPALVNVVQELIICL